MSQLRLSQPPVKGGATCAVSLKRDRSMRDSDSEDESNGLEPYDWTGSKAGKRPRPQRLTEVLKIKRRSVRPRSPLRGRSDKKRRMTVVVAEGVSSRLLPEQCPATPPATKPIPCGQDAFFVAAKLGEAIGRPYNAVRGSWSAEEDAWLKKAIAVLCKDGAPGHKVPWSVIAVAVPGRSQKQCRERFVEHLDVNIVADAIVGDEIAIVYFAHGKHGTHWTRVAAEVNEWRVRMGFCGVRSAASLKNFLTAKTKLLTADAGRPAVAKKATVPEKLSEELPELPAFDEDLYDMFKAFVESEAFGEEVSENVQKGHAIVKEGDVEIAQIDDAWQLLLNEPQPSLVAMEDLDMPPSGLGVLAAVGRVQDTAETIIEELPRSRCYPIPGLVVVKDRAPRTCVTAKKMCGQIMHGDRTPRRHLFAAINSMVNGASGSNQAKDGEVSMRRPRPMASSVGAMRTSAEVWAAVAS